MAIRMPTRVNLNTANRDLQSGSRSQTPRLGSGPKNSGKATGQKGRRRRYELEDLEPAIRPIFKKFGTVSINAKLLTARLLPFNNPTPELAQAAVDGVEDDSGIRVQLREKEPPYEIVSAAFVLVLVDTQRTDATVHEILIRLREWRNELGASGEAAADYYVGLLRDEIRRELLDRGITDTDTRYKDEMKNRISAEMRLLLGNANDLMRPFWWKEWVDKNNKSVTIKLRGALQEKNSDHHSLSQGFFKFPVILYVFGAHLDACKINVDDIDDYCKPPQVGALMLSIMAVSNSVSSKYIFDRQTSYLSIQAERGLAFWCQGEKNIPSGMEKWFSVEKWRDDQYIVDYDGANVKDKRQKILQKYVEALDDAQWVSIFMAALELRAEWNTKRHPREKNERVSTIDLSPAEDDDLDDAGWDYHVHSDPITGP